MEWLQPPRPRARTAQGDYSAPASPEARRARRFSSFSALYSTYSTIVLDFELRARWKMMQTTAMVRPSAVLFIASEMPLESITCFISGLAAPREAKVWMRPQMVPTSPTRVAMLASDQSEAIRLEMAGVTSSTASSRARATSCSPFDARVRPARTTRERAAFGA